MKTKVNLFVGYHASESGKQWVDAVEIFNEDGTMTTYAVLDNKLAEVVHNSHFNAYVTV